MTMHLTSQLRLTLGWQYLAASGLSEVADRGALVFKGDLASGTAAQEANRVWHARLEVPGEGEVDLDLHDALTDAFGQSLELDNFKGLVVHNLGEAPEGLLVGGGSDALSSWLGAAGDRVRVAAGGVLLVWNPTDAGFAVVPDSADTLRISNTASTAVEVEVVLLGVAD